MANKTKIKFENFLVDLKLLCDKHNVDIVGTCTCEGIYGEITLVDRDNPNDCKCGNVLNHISYKLCGDDNNGYDF